MIEIAKILKAQGVRGEVKVQLFSDSFDAFENRGFAYIKTSDTPKRIDYTVLREDPPFIYMQIKGIDTRNDAEKLKGVFLYLERNELEPAEEGEYYIVDLIGLEIVDEEGNKLGRLDDVLQHGAADVYSVKGDRNFMFPALKRVINKVDLRNKVIIVDGKALEEVAVYDDI